MADKQFRFVVPGEDGAGDQVFEADTLEEYNDKFAKAQANATAKIREQAQELAAERAARQQESHPAQNANDPDAWIAEFAPKVISKFFDGLPPEVIKKKFVEMDERAYLDQRDRIGTALFNKYPEIAGTSTDDGKHNGSVIDKIHTDNALPDTQAGYEAALLLARQDGKLKLAPTEQQPEIMQPVPSTVTRPSVQVNTNESRTQFLTTAPTEDVRKFLEKEWAAKQRA